MRRINQLNAVHSPEHMMQDHNDYGETTLAPLEAGILKILTLVHGLDEEIIVAAGWKYMPARRGSWIAIPYFLNGKIVNYKYMSMTLERDVKAMHMPSVAPIFYNFDVMSHADEIIITDNEFDAIIAMQSGYRAVSIPDRSLHDLPENYTHDYADIFPALKVALLAFTDDHKGNATRQELALELGWHRCKWAQYPKGCKNLREVLKKFGRAGIDKVLKEKSKFMNEGGLFRMSELPAKPDLPAYECLISTDLSPMIKIRRGDLIVLLGKSGMGKSLFVNCLAANIAQHYGWHVCIGSFESDPRGSIQKYLRTHYMHKIPALASDEDISAADVWINKSFSFIVPDIMSEMLTSLEWMMERIKASVIQNKAEFVILDPWNEIDHMRPNGMNESDYTGYAIKQLKRLAKRYMIAMLIVVHPPKMERKSDGEFPVPTLGDAHGSAHWSNKTDLGIIVHRYPGDLEGTWVTYVNIEKVREWGVIGKIGTKYIQYHEEDGTYTDLPDFKPAKKKRNKTTTIEEDVDKATGKQSALPYKD